MRRHLEILAYLHLASAGVYGVVAVLAVGLALGGETITGDEAAFFLSKAVPLALALVTTGLAVASLAGGYGLLKRKPWARSVLIVVGFLTLASVPIGTLLAVYTLWILLQDEAVRELSRDRPWPTDLRR